MPREELLMRSTVFAITCSLVVALGSSGITQQPPTAAPPAQSEAVDTVKVLVGQLDLEKYKATIKGLTQFGDRREGTERNRKAVDWIEAQLKSYGCTNTERIKYEVTPGTGRGGGAGRGGAGRGNEPTRVPAGTPDDPVRRGAGGKGVRRPHRREQRSQRPTGSKTSRAEHGARAARAA
jgi:hypothetical protein